MDEFMENTPAEEEAVLPEEPQAPLAERVTVVDIRFRNNEKTYFFDPDGLEIAEGANVIIDTARGMEFGICTAGNHEVSSSEIVPPLRKVIRIATIMDERINAENLEKEKKAFAVCQQKVEEHKLDMQLVSAEAAFDGSKLLFFFTADGRVDFRELVKDLASVFRTRIELRQIGVRDKAKMVGGLGVCGRPFCCKEFLDDFQPVSIKMAKTQSLSLNPTKISGVCGRLMCCLKYEQDAYEDLIRTSPKAESLVDTPDGRGTVTEVNLLRQSVKVRMEDQPENIGCYQNCDICVLRNGKARKNDPPIPKDVAPISSQPRKPAVKEEPEQEDDFLPELIYSDTVVNVAPEQPEKEPAPAVQEAPQEPKSGNRSHRSRHHGSRPHNAEGENKPKQEKAESAHPQPKAAHSSSPKPAQKAPQSGSAEGSAPKPGGNHRRRYHHRGSGSRNSNPPSAE